MDGVTLKANGMTWSMMRWMRKFFNDAGWKRALPSEERIKNKLKCYDIPYETGHFNTPFVDYDKLNYIHLQIRDYGIPLQRGQSSAIKQDN